MNNISFPGGPGDVVGGYLSNNGVNIGLPTRGSIGFSISGQMIFPVYNNRGEYTPLSCEVDKCNEHVGQGGGQPHLHGDPFGASCLYSAANYTTLGHPPLIGWSNDGPSIYGRHLSYNDLGYNYTLDSCGGHTHDSYGYHYHT